MSSIQQEELMRLDLLKMLGKQVNNSPKWWWKMVIYHGINPSNNHQTKTNQQIQVTKSTRMIPNVLLCRCKIFPNALIKGETSTWKQKIRWNMDVRFRERFYRSPEKYQSWDNSHDAFMGIVYLAYTHDWFAYYDHFLVNITNIISFGPWFFGSFHEQIFCQIFVCSSTTLM